MPQVDPAAYRSLSLHVESLTTGFELHDVWAVELDGTNWTIPRLHALIASDHAPAVNPAVRFLFGFRSLLGRLFRLDERPGGAGRSTLVPQVPHSLAASSLEPPGSAARPFTALFILDHEAAYEAHNATVHAILSVALVGRAGGQTFYWATWLRPVGRITAAYMALIDPFRRRLVYPGLESWLLRACRVTMRANDDVTAQPTE